MECFGRPLGEQSVPRTHFGAPGDRRALFFDAILVSLGDFVSHRAVWVAILGLVGCRSGFQIVVWGIMWGRSAKKEVPKR